MTKWGIYLVLIGLVCFAWSFFIDRIGMKEPIGTTPEQDG